MKYITIEYNAKENTMLVSAPPRRAMLHSNVSPFSVARMIRFIIKYEYEPYILTHGWLVMMNVEESQCTECENE